MWESYSADTYMGPPPPPGPVCFLVLGAHLQLGPPGFRYPVPPGAPGLPGTIICLSVVCCKFAPPGVTPFVGANPVSVSLGIFYKVSVNTTIFVNI